MEHSPGFCELCCQPRGDGHEQTQRHKCNIKLNEYSKNRKSLHGNRYGANVSCSFTTTAQGSNNIACTKQDILNMKIIVPVRPNCTVVFKFKINNDSKKYDLELLGLQLAHPQEQFRLHEHPYQYGGEPHVLRKDDGPVIVEVTFQPTAEGAYEMPIVFTFRMPDKEQKDKNKKQFKDFVIIREMVVYATNAPKDFTKIPNPFKMKKWISKFFIKSSVESNHVFPIPIPVKEALKKINKTRRTDINDVDIEFENILSNNRTKDNYEKFFHNLLWWEELESKRYLVKYNMTDVSLEKNGSGLDLEVPGLCEKRPSLIQGDKVAIFISKLGIEFEGSIKRINENTIHIGNFNYQFWEHFGPDEKFQVRFIKGRHAVECMHKAIAVVSTPQIQCRLFPEPIHQLQKIKKLTKFYNTNILSNVEQKNAVEHIVSKSSGTVPYLLFGPPGTGKTVTAVEAIIQIVLSNPRHRVWVCTDSNMAADHIAMQLLRFQAKLNISDFLFRANSRKREWSTLPPELGAVSNGTSYESSYSIKGGALTKYRVVVTTLIHAAKYSSSLQVSHLFVDEASQSLEPAVLIPLTGLLAPDGQLVLAGDPRQLGPVLTSNGAKNKGLGVSFMEKLYTTYTNLYGDHDEQKYRYITILVNNFRSDADILEIPNEKFYDNKLKVCAEPDPLSRASILGLEGGRRAMVFHAVNGIAQKVGKSPSFFNNHELEIVKQYITAAIEDHQVRPCDIGIISPYMRQVIKIKEWLIERDLGVIDVGTVEAFQGKEKRLIVVSTVRGAVKPLGTDQKYSLGFVSDEKRFNVAVTRAKAKLIIIGNKSALETSLLWVHYMEWCRARGAYLGGAAEQLPRTTDLLADVALDRFNTSKLAQALAEVAVNRNANGY